MSRLTLGNVVKVALAVLLLPFVAYLVLLIGAVKKNIKVLLEGTIYAAAFSVAVWVLDTDGVEALLGMAAMGASGVRSYHLRDLWLPKKRQRSRGAAPLESHEPAQVAAQAPSVALGEPANDLSSALAWVSSHAKQNKYRLPSDAYVTILETCQTLDVVVDAERRQPSADARLEYELNALVREYLPVVLNGYLAVPPSVVDNRQPNGRTPNEELVEQLQLLSGQAEALHMSRHSHTSAELTSSGNFLREKFGHRQRAAFDFGIE